MPKMKPILFNTEMVKAILDGRKTVTRRIVKDVPIAIVNRAYRKPGTGDWAFYSESGIVRDIKQRYQIGDILYVRETWQQNYDGSYAYRAGHKFECEKGWRPSIHMPKEAARIFLRVTNVRVERLHDITAEECVREGIPKESLTEVGYKFTKGQFEDLWDSTVKPDDKYKYGWIANPWVWVIEFEKINREDI